MKEWTVKKGYDKVYPWELVDADGVPIAKFCSEADALKAAKAFSETN